MKTEKQSTTTKSRFEVREGSQSCHCCFDYTVVDTTKPEDYEDHCHTMCECFDKEEAEQIAAALNVFNTNK